MTTPLVAETWTEVAICELHRIRRESGAAALVRGEAVAVFRTHDDEVFALSNVDPVAGASVMSRGIVGTRRGVPFVASPMHKQAWGLRDGICLDDETLRITTYDVRVEAGVVVVGAARAG
jgi:nitrite reductase (NADH) small subunit